MHTSAINLLNFLSSLPNLTSRAERKAFVSFTGYAFIGLYLDYDNSQVAFAEGMVDEISRHGQDFMLRFLQALENTPQIGPTQQAQLAEISGQLRGLSSADWVADFRQRPLTTTPIIDRDMLALTTVTNLLLPYYRRNSDEVQAQMMEVGATIVQQIEQILLANAIIQPVLTLFQAHPQDLQPALLVTLKSVLMQDDILAQELAQTLAPVAQHDSAMTQVLVTITQNLGAVSGAVVGAIVGQDIVGKLAVKQDVDTVTAGGSVVGAVIGDADALHIGGQTVAGDIIAGDKIEGDKITTGDITESNDVTIGRS